MNDQRPDNAEQFQAIKYYKSESRPSLLVPNAEQQVWALTCPGCGIKHDDPPALTTIKCDCGLSMWFAAATLFVWRTETEKAEP